MNEILRRLACRFEMYRYDRRLSRLIAEEREAAPQPTLAEPHPERYSLEAAENGDYPALCDDPTCKPCQASEKAWAAEDQAADTAWLAAESALTESRRADYEAGETP